MLSNKKLRNFVKLGRFIFSAVISRIRYLKHYFIFIKDFRSFMKEKDDRFCIKWSDRYPCLYDKTVKTTFDRHYVLHTAWAARILVREKPKIHIDVSSSLYFNVLMSAFVPIEFYDYRPADLNLSGLKSGKADLLKLPFLDNSVKSISCMHVIEHIGLGRYGDQLDPQGDLKAITELKRVLAVNGNLLFVVPIGKSKIVFNAHRIYSYGQITEYFRGFQLVEFALIPDESEINELIVNAGLDIVDKQNYGCGCFWFRKCRV
jgi:hypothetical protein